MSTLVLPRLLTAEEFLDLPEEGLPKELVRGCILETAMPSPEHGYICMNIGYWLTSFVKEHDLSQVLSNDSFFITRRNPDSVRGSDICFYSYARQPKEPLAKKAAEQAPELVFEVRSPSDRWVKVLSKTAEYLEAGVSVVGIVDPENRTVSVYRPDEIAKNLTYEDDFVLSDILPGLKIPVRKFFEEPEYQLCTTKAIFRRQPVDLPSSPPASMPSSSIDSSKGRSTA